MQVQTRPSSPPKHHRCTDRGGNLRITLNSTSHHLLKKAASSSNWELPGQQFSLSVAISTQIFQINFLTSCVNNVVVTTLMLMQRATHLMVVLLLVHCPPVLT